MSWIDTALVLDRNIVLLEQRLYTLRAQRNSITPLCRLPDETIERILLLVQGQCDDIGWLRNSEYTATSTKWTRAVGTCRRLREVALNSAALWAAINWDHKCRAWINLCLERAGHHPLRWNSSLRHMDDQPSILCLGMIPLCRHIRLTIRPPAPLNYERSLNFIWEIKQSGLIELLNDVLSGRQLQLTSLELFNHSSDRDDQFLTLKNTFLGGNSVNLTHLLLDKVDFDGVPHLPSLKRLIISHVPNDLACRKLRAILHQTPNLEDLSIAHPYSPATLLTQDTSPDAIPDISKEGLVNLNHLHTLELRGELSQIAQVIQLFHRPGKDFDLRIWVDDECHPSTHSETYMGHLAVLSDQILNRIATYLPYILEDLIRIDCSIGTCYDDTQTKEVNLTLHWKKLKADGDGMDMQTTDFHLICPPKADTSNAICWANCMDISVSNNGDIANLDHEIVGSDKLTSLTITSLGDSTDYDQELEDFERLLSERAGVQTKPIEHLTMEPLGESAGIPDCPLELQEELADRWITAGWVKCVVWNNPNPN